MAGESHFEHLLTLLELEQRESTERLRAYKAERKNAELVAEGLALSDISASAEHWGLGRHLVVTFERPGRAPIEGRWEPGNVVALWLRRAEGEAVGATVVRRERARLQLAFDRPPPAWVTLGRVWLEAAETDVTFERARKAVRTIAAWTHGKEKRRQEVLLGSEPPRFVETSTGAFANLNPEQCTAVARALGACDFFLVHGPPGTGKSTVLIALAKQMVADGKRLLLSAASNGAVDHLLDRCIAADIPSVRIGHPARIAEHLFEHSLEAQLENTTDYVLAKELVQKAFALRGYAKKQRAHGRSSARFANAKEAQAEARRLLGEARALEQRATAALFARTPVVCATLAGLWSEELSHQSFDVALVDEATQAIEPLALGAFAKAESVVLAGDHKQLPPTVLSAAAEHEGLGQSLFERLLHAHGDSVRFMLREQYRMSAALMQFPSRTMYDNALIAHPSVSERRLVEILDHAQGLVAPPILFIDTAGRGFDEEQPTGSTSFCNPGEAELLIARARELLAAGLSPHAIAVIAPYSAQVSELRQRAAADATLSGLEIDSVDGFQGREREVVLLSLTRANSRGELGFLRDTRRLNVAVTRARSHLFVVGDSGTVGQHPYYQALIDTANTLGGYLSVWEWPLAQDICY